MSRLTQRSVHECFGGTMGFYTHHAETIDAEMRFSVFLPETARHGRRPALYYLAGLTCTEETFMIKAGAQRYAAEAGLVLIAPDTSPRGLGLSGETESWDFGEGAGFYVDATQAPWAAHYRMFSYVNQELPELVEAQFPVTPNVRGIFGHSMGGHGALVTALKYPDRWGSVSAFAPISNPSRVPWGGKAFSRYLGQDKTQWAQYDASHLIAASPYPKEILVDQGLADQFLTNQLHPEALEAASKQSGQALRLRYHAGYDHSCWFIQTFMADHIAWHAKVLIPDASLPFT